MDKKENLMQVILIIFIVTIILFIGLFYIGKGYTATQTKEKIVAIIFVFGLIGALIFSIYWRIKRKSYKKE